MTRTQQASQQQTETEGERRTNDNLSVYLFRVNVVEVSERNENFNIIQKYPFQQ